MQAGKVANHPLTLVQFPVEGRPPLLASDDFPAFGKPPTKVLITAGAHKLKKVAVAIQGAVNGEVLPEHLMRRLLVVESEIVIQIPAPLSARGEGLGVRMARRYPTPTLATCGEEARAIAKPEQPAFDFR